MKILYVTTVAITMGFFPAHIKMLQDEGHTVELACNLDEPLPEKVAVLGCPVHHIPFSRSPLNRENIAAYRELKRLLSENHYDIVHTHTPNASAAVRLACRKLRKHGLRVFYTAHGFHFYDGAPLANWLLFYPVEWLCSHWTDVLITINREDYARAQKRLHAKKTVYIPGVGLDTAKFTVNLTSEEKLKKREELGIPSDAVVLVSVGELNQNKNHSVIIRAIAVLNNQNFHYCIAGEGPLRQELQQLSLDLGLEKQVHLLGFRTDIPQLYASADICCFPSIREGLGMAALEGMACGLPVVASDNRGSRDLVEQNKGGLLCRPDDAEGFAAAVETLTLSPEVRGTMEIYNRATVEAFSLQQVLGKLQQTYNISNDVE